MFAGLACGWWMYVPVHELLHAVGCLVGGGEVSELQIQALYGGSILSRFIPFVTAGGQYAGRLSGFDTRGSDWTYALTVYFPFFLSWAGYRLLGAAWLKRRAFGFGFFLPWALAPLVSLGGDFLELGSLLLFQLWPGPGGIHRTLISDDLTQVLGMLGSGAAGPLTLGSGLPFVLASFFVGTVLAWFTLVLACSLSQAQVKKVLKEPP